MEGDSRVNKYIACCIVKRYKWNYSIKTDKPDEKG